MMDSQAFQLQIDNKLAQKATDIFSSLGLDLKTAIELFLNRSVQVRGIPFAMRLPDKRDNSSSEVIAAMKNMSRMAEEAGVANMTLEEINAEINAVRHGDVNA